MNGKGLPFLVLKLVKHQPDLARYFFVRYCGPHDLYIAAGSATVLKFLKEKHILEKKYADLFVKYIDDPNVIQTLNDLEAENVLCAILQFANPIVHYKQYYNPLLAAYDENGHLVDIKVARTRLEHSVIVAAQHSHLTVIKALLATLKIDDNDLCQALVDTDKPQRDIRVLKMILPVFKCKEKLIRTVMYYFDIRALEWMIETGYINTIEEFEYAQSIGCEYWDPDHPIKCLLRRKRKEKFAKTPKFVWYLVAFVVWVIWYYLF